MDGNLNGNMYYRSLDFDSLATLVYTIVNSQIDYCNTVLACD